MLAGLGVFLFIGGWLEVDYQRRKADVPGWSFAHSPQITLQPSLITSLSIFM